MAATLSPATIAELAQAHETARVTAVPCDPVTRQHPDATLEDAYAIQAQWIRLQREAGSQVIGHKIGLTSRAMQQAMHIDEPDFGALLDYMDIPSGSTIESAKYLDPKLEVEFAFVLAHDLVGNEVIDHDPQRRLTSEDVYTATDHVLPALELIDARSHRTHPADGRTRTVLDTISDNAANAGIVVGTHQVSVADARAGALRWAGAICRRNGVVEETGLGAGVLDDPVQGVVWLANRMQHLGIPLRAGETILAGSFTRPVNCRPGDQFEVDFGSLGTLTLDVA